MGSKRKTTRQMIRAANQRRELWWAVSLYDWGARELAWKKLKKLASEVNDNDY